MSATEAPRRVEANPVEETAASLLGMVQQLADEIRPHSAQPARAHLDSSLERDLALDSLARVELLLRLEREFEVSLSEQEISAAETPRDLLRIVLGSSAPGPSGGVFVEVEAPALERVEATPEEATTLVGVLDWHVASHPERTHIFLYGDGDEIEEITYAALAGGAEEVAAGLRERDLAPGQAVAIMLPTSREYFFSFYGILLAGGIPVPLYPPARPSQIEDHLRRQVGILRNCRAPILITVPEAKALARLVKSQAEELRSVVTVEELQGSGGSAPRPNLTSRDIAFLQYTSGSTGQPKGVILTNANLLANLRAMGRAARCDSSDIFISWLPLYHDMGLIGAGMGSLYFAFPLVLMSPLVFLTRPQRWLWAIHRHRGTITAGPNFAYELCLTKVADEEIEGLDLSSVRLAGNGAETVSPQTIARFCERYGAYGFRRDAMAPLYGLAENCLGLAFPPPGRVPVIDRIQRQPFFSSGKAVPAAADGEDALQFASCGFPIPGHEVRIVDATGSEVQEREEGRLQFKGPSTTSGYFRSAEATRKLFDGDWVHSGDRAYIADGEIYLTGRSKDIIIRAGRNFSPYELEEAVGDLEGVRKGCVAVFGVADPESGTERLVVMAETRETDAAARQRIEGTIIETTVDLLGTPPDDVVLAPPRTVLKTSSGKIRRAASSELYLNGRLGAQRQVWRQLLRLAVSGLLPVVRRSLRVMGHFFHSLYTWALFGLDIVLLGLIVAVLPGERRRQAVVRQGARWLCRLGRIPVVVEGLEKIPRGEPSILAANHSSYLDAVVLTAGLPTGFAIVAKRELAKNRLARWLLSRIGVEFVERFRREQGVEDARRIRDDLLKGRSLVFFPEGTFSRMPGLLPFRMGMFVAAAEAGAPVVPVVIRGTRSILRAESWIVRRGPVSISVYPATRPRGSDWSSAVELRDRTRAEMLRRTGEPDLADQDPSTKLTGQSGPRPSGRGNLGPA